jgi:hypothetical protein
MAWAPHLIGLVFVALLFCLVHFAPDSEWTKALLTTYGVRGSGSDGALLRRDHLRGALVSFLLWILFAVLGFGGFLWAERYPGMSRANWTWSAYAFGFTLLAGVSALCCVGALYRAVTWKAPASPRTSLDEWRGHDD